MFHLLTTNNQGPIEVCFSFYAINRQYYQRIKELARKELYNSIKIQGRVFQGAVDNYSIEIFTDHFNTT